MKEWTKIYGPVFSLKIGPSNTVVLCDRKAIHQLLVEKGSIYSDRPPSYVGKLLTQGDHLALDQIQYREECRREPDHPMSASRTDAVTLSAAQNGPDA